jgi:2-amino-4-hydroxy-6-hydroxymethyldihydropteridine diphosphokinase
MINELVLSLGSNIEPRTEYLKQAICLLNDQFKLVKKSSYYETEPVDDINQANFYNMAVIYETNLDDPYKVLKIIQDIELQIGRVKDNERPKGPRKIDIDIIFFGNIIIKSQELNIPHERFSYRKFVLMPILEILDNDSKYLKSYDFSGFLDKITDQRIKLIGDLKIE